MKSRTVAVILGLLAAIATFLALNFDSAGTLKALGVDRAGLAPLLADGPARIAWAISAAVAVFAAIALVIAFIGGLVEVSASRRAIDALRYDPSRVGRWNLADWRAAFASTSIADRAEAMIATIGHADGPADGPFRRFAVDTAILVGLDETWLDRLTLNRVVSPLAPLVAASGATVALTAAAGGGQWEAALASGAAGWLFVRMAQYLVRLALWSGVARVVDAATAAIRPLTAIDAVPDQTAPNRTGYLVAAAPPAGLGEYDAAELADAVARALGDTLDRLAAAVESLSAAAMPPAREQSIDAALAEIRAGIERLLEDSGAAPD
jgi:hypothetical protein